MIRITSYFLSKPMGIRRHWNKNFTMLKEKNYQPRIPCPVKIPFSEGDIKLFTSERKLRIFFSEAFSLK